MFDDYPQRKKHIDAEKSKAKELRKSRWWQTLITSCSCYYCQKPLHKEEVTMDHIVPVSQGGFSKKGNVVPACNHATSQREIAQLWS